MREAVRQAVREAGAGGCRCTSRCPGSSPPRGPAAPLPLEPGAASRASPAPSAPGAPGLPAPLPSLPLLAAPFPSLPSLPAPLHRSQRCRRSTRHGSQGRAERGRGRAAGLAVMPGAVPGAGHASLPAARTANFRLFPSARSRHSSCQPSLGRRRVFVVLWIGELSAWRWTDLGALSVWGKGRGGKDCFSSQLIFVFWITGFFWSYMEGSQDGVHQENQNFSVHLRDFEWND